MKTSKQLIVFFLLLLLTACNTNNPSTPAVGAPAATETLLTPTDTAVPSPRIVLLAPPETDPILLAEIEPEINTIAAENAIQVEVSQALDPAALPANMQLVVAAPSSPNLPDLVAAAPQVQFVALMIPGLTPADNLTVISPGGQDALNQGFIAGYIATVLTDDYRVGSITSFSQPGYRQGFITGARFYCGLCPQLYPPYHEYPLSAEINANPSPAEWQSAADQLLTSSVNTIFIAPDIADSALFEYLAQKDINFISTVVPPETAKSNWLLAIEYDIPTVLQQVLPAVLQNGAMEQVNAPLSLHPSDSALLGPGYIAHFDHIINQLQQGAIDPGY